MNMIARRKKDEEFEEEKKKVQKNSLEIFNINQNLIKAKRQIESLDKHQDVSGKPAYTYGYNGEIVRTKFTVPPKKNDLAVKTR